MDTFGIYLIILMLGGLLTVIGAVGLARYKPQTTQITINQPARVVIYGDAVHDDTEAVQATIEAPSLPPAQQGEMVYPPTFDGQHRWYRPEQVTSTLIPPIPIRKQVELEHLRSADEESAMQTAKAEALDLHSLHVYVLGCAYAVDRDDSDQRLDEGLTYYHTFEHGLMHTHYATEHIQAEIRHTWKQIK